MLCLWTKKTKKLSYYLDLEGGRMESVYDGASSARANVMMMMMMVIIRPLDGSPKSLESTDRLKRLGVVRFFL